MSNDFVIAEGQAGDDGVFPHLYNGNQIGKKEIESVKSPEKIQVIDDWEEALSSLVADGWMLY